MARKKKDESTEPKINLYQEFNKWIFDGNIKTPIPYPELMLKYNSPINHVFLIRMFLNHGKANHYLNEVFNNINLRYLEIDELFIFIKQCVIDFKLQKNQLPFFKWKTNNKLYDILRKKFPYLKGYDVNLLCDLINDSSESDAIYNALGLDEPKKEKIKKNNKKNNIDDFILNNFEIIVE